MIASKTLRLGVFYAEGVHSDLLHHLLFSGPVVPVGPAGDDGVGGLHALDYPAESGVAAVQVGKRLHHNEELAAAGVWVRGPGHGQYPPAHASGRWGSRSG